MKRVSWRYFLPEDRPYVLAMHVQQEAKLGRAMDLPDLWEQPVISAIVGETNGKITHCLFLEAEAEICALAGGPLSSRDLENAAAILKRDAQRYNLRIVRAFVPVQALQDGSRSKKPMVRRLLEKAGFTRENKTIQQYFRLIPSLVVVAEDDEEAA